MRRADDGRVQFCCKLCGSQFLAAPSRLARQVLQRLLLSAASLVAGKTACLCSQHSAQLVCRRGQVAGLAAYCALAAWPFCTHAGMYCAERFIVLLNQGEPVPKSLCIYLKPIYGSLCLRGDPMSRSHSIVDLQQYFTRFVSRQLSDTSQTYSMIGGIPTMTRHTCAKVEQRDDEDDESKRSSTCLLHDPDLERDGKGDCWMQT